MAKATEPVKNQEDEIIFRNIMQKFSGMNSIPYDWKQLRRLKRRDSLIFKAKSASYGKMVAIKVFDTKKVKPDIPSHVFRVMKQYSGSGNVAAPYALFEEHNAVIMEWVKSPRFKDLLVKKKAHGEDRLKMVENSARWLRWFHEQSGVKIEAYDSTALIRKIESGAKRSNVTDKAFLNCLKTLKKASLRLGALRLEHAVLHDDFTPSNVFMQDEKAIGFDFIARRRGMVMHDACRMLNYLAVYRSGFTRLKKFRTYGCHEDDYRHFISAYAAKNQLPREVFLYLQFSEIMRRWLVLLQLKKKRSRLRKKIEKSRIRRLAKAVEKELRMVVK